MHDSIDKSLTSTIIYELLMRRTSVRSIKISDSVAKGA